MISGMFLELAILAVAVAGLASVVVEILVRDRSALAEIAADSRRFAEPVLRSNLTPFVAASFDGAAPANSNAWNAAAA